MKNIYLVLTFVLCLSAFAPINAMAQAPTITSFSPILGKPGDNITLTGTGFNTTIANNIVFFGATKAIVTAATATSVTVTVPTGATFAPITLLNTGTSLAAYSLSNFTPIYSPAKTTITASDFATKVDFTTGSGPVSVAMGDLDGDGKPDLAVVNAEPNTVSVYRNTSVSGSIGAGSFAPKVDFATGTQPVSVAMGDLDGDGKPDLVVTNRSSATVSVYRNTSTIGSIGSDSFATKLDFATGVIPQSVAIGDLDEDGKPDLAVANLNSNTISVLRNTSTSGSIDASSFAAKVDFTTGSGPVSVAIGDLNGDGKPDLAVANYLSNTISVFRNTSTSGSIGLGSFAAKVDFTTGDLPISVAMGDLDGDGRPDLAVANYNSNTVSIRRNTSGSIGLGSFAAKVDFATGTSPFSVAIGDLDGDGKPDLVVANESSNTVSVIRNTSTSGSIELGSFVAKVDFTTGENPRSVAVGDLDGDGKPDLAVGNTYANMVSVLRNVYDADLSALTISPGTLSPTFTAANTTYTTTVSNATTSITVTPTRPDASATIQVRANGGSYVPVLSGSASAALSLNVGNNTIEILVTAVQDGTTTKTYTITVTRGLVPTITSFTPTNAVSGATVTLTGTNFNPTPASNIVFFGATRATVTAASATSVTLTVPSGATYAPITLLNTETSLMAYSLSNFTPTFSPVKTAITVTDFQAKQDFATGSFPSSVAVGDLDGDGKPDLAVVNSLSNTVSVYRNTSSSGSIGLGSFAAKVDFATGLLPLSVAIGDLDGDGKPDLAVTNGSSFSNTVSVYRNTSSSGNIGLDSFTAKVDFATGSLPRSVAIGDLDGDGKPDLAVANTNSATVSVYRNTSSSGNIGLGSFAAKVDFATGESPFSVAISDLDGDGKPDLAVANNFSSTISVIQNTSTFGSINNGSFATKVDFTTDEGPFSVAIGDLDGDGKPDLAVANDFSNTISVIRNKSTSGSINIGSFATKVDFATGDTPQLVAVGDLDGDGKPDLAVANDGSATVSVFRNTATSGSIGLGSFAAKVDFATGSGPRSVAMGDLDGDGKPDLAVANLDANTVAVFRNTSNNADLSALSLSSGTLSPVFAASTTAYTANVSNASSSITVTPTKADANASSITVNGVAVSSGTASGSINLNVGSNTITVVVTAQDLSTKTYTVTVTVAVPCQNQVTLVSPSDDYTSGTYQKVASSSAGKITATNKLTGTTNVIYRAKAIELNIGFKAERGTVFLAEVGGCN